MRTTETMTTGQLASQAGVGVETVRFYERRGLVPEPPRRPSGYRAYPPEALDRLLFIRRAKHLGFSLAEIEELLGLSRDAHSACPEVKGRLQTKVQEIETRISSLERLRDSLVALSCLCPPPGSEDAACPVLDTLQAGDGTSGGPGRE